MPIVLTENFRALFYAPFYAAEAIGAYCDAGVAVELRTSPDPLSTAAALRAGETDVMWGGPLRVLLTAQDDPAAGLVCVANVVERDPFFIVGRLPRPDFTVADLEGMKLGTVSEVPTPWLCLQDDLRRAGVAPARVHRRPGNTMAENVQRLALGELQAVQLFQPYVERLVSSGAGHIWYAAADRGLTAYTTLVTRRDVLETKPGEILAMNVALTKTLAWFAATEGAEIAGVLAEYFPDVTQPILAAAIDRYRALKLWASSTVLAREGFERLQDAMISGGVLRKRIAFETCVDNTLAEQAV
jgi:NitT/TauT family transport system substrate-binding protein